RKRLENKLDVIKGLERARTGPVRLFDEISNLAPDRLWLSQLKVEDGAVALQGSSLDTGIVADFLRSMNQSEFFKNVDLKKTKGGKEVEGVRLVDFNIRAEYGSRKPVVEAKGKKGKKRKKKGRG
ncbi:MAG: PilN domain-containing protein, partial [bacterium]|nr:PilN domain-containing protein [bacterium]